MRAPLGLFPSRATLRMRRTARRIVNQRASRLTCGRLSRRRDAAVHGMQRGRRRDHASHRYAAPGLSLGQRDLGTCIIARAVSAGGSAFRHKPRSCTTGSSRRRFSGPSIARPVTAHVEPAARSRRRPSPAGARLDPAPFELPRAPPAAATSRDGQRSVDGRSQQAVTAREVGAWCAASPAGSAWEDGRVTTTRCPGHRG